MDEIERLVTENDRLRERHNDARSQLDACRAELLLTAQALARAQAALEEIADCFDMEIAGEIARRALEGNR